MDWSEATMDQLRTLWAEGHSTAEIGRRMGVTKNVVVGKAHRMGLPGRESPIASSSRSAQATQRRAEILRQAIPLADQGFTCEAIGAQLGVDRETIGAMLRAIGKGRQGGRRAAIRTLPPVLREEAPVRERRADFEAAPRPALPPAPIAAHPLIRAGKCGCRWPIGEPRQPGFRYCNAPDVLPGKPYCLEHCGRAYTAPLINGLAMAPRGWAA